VFATSTYWWENSSSDLKLYMLSDVVAVGVYDPNFFTQNNIDPGYVWFVYTYKSRDQVIRLPIEVRVVQQLSRYDVGVSSTLWVTLGTKLAGGDYANAVGTGTVLSTCWTGSYPRVNGGFVPVLYCHVLTTYLGNEPGNSGSPVYQLVTDANGYPVGVKAYGVASGRILVNKIPQNNIIAPLSFGVDVNLIASQ